MLPKSCIMPNTSLESSQLLNSLRMWGTPSHNRNDILIGGDPVVAFGTSKTALDRLSFDRNTENSGMVSSVL